jgi:hypothetical protein
MNMASTQSIDARGSAQAMISGYPAMAEHTETYLDQFEHILNGAIADAQNWAAENLRSLASRLPGWKEIASSLDVEFDGDSFAYMIHGQQAQEIANILEYGDAHTAPTGFLRKTALVQGPVMGKRIEYALSSEVPSG